jgi:hypothetical protein
MKKVIIYSVIANIAMWSLTIWFKTFVEGNYWNSNPLYLTLILACVPVLVVFCSYKAIKHIKNLAMIAVVFVLALMSSCGQYAKNNQIVLYTENGGVSWKRVTTGERTPSGTMNPLFYKEILPATEMLGDMYFKTSYAENVKSDMIGNYAYTIEDPILFMTFAKKLNSTNATADEAQNDDAKFEGAENRVIESVIKRIINDHLDKEDVVTHDINALELVYLDLCNIEMAKRGVKITSLELIPKYGEQTEQAIDVANAVRIYEAKGLAEFGKQLSLAKAGANKIIISSGQSVKSIEKDGD